jgi:hypothetical protein
MIDYKKKYLKYKAKYLAYNKILIGGDGNLTNTKKIFYIDRPNVIKYTTKISNAQFDVAIICNLLNIKYDILETNTDNFNNEYPNIKMIHNENSLLPQLHVIYIPDKELDININTNLSILINLCQYYGLSDSDLSPLLGNFKNFNDYFNNFINNLKFNKYDLIYKFIINFIKNKTNLNKPTLKQNPIDKQYSYLSNQSIYILDNSPVKKRRPIDIRREKDSIN